MSKQKITTTSLKALSNNTSGSQRISDTELLGFYARRRKTGIFYYLNYTISSNRQTLSIGHYPTITAEQARNIVKQYLGRIAGGEDIRKTIEDEKFRLKSEKYLTVRSYLEKVYAITLKRKKTGKDTQQSIEKHFVGWMDKQINNINAQDVHQWQIEMENKDLSFRGIECPYDKFKTMLNHAVKNGFIESHKLNAVQLEKPQLSQSSIDSSNKRISLSKIQIRNFFDALDSHQEINRIQRRNSRKHGKKYLPNLDIVKYVDHVVPWLLVMYYTGFRHGDIFGLQWEHINFHNNTIRKVIEKTAHQCPEPKTFPIAEPLIKILKTWQRQLGNPTSGLVFISPRTNGRFNSKAMKNPWKQIRKLAKLPEDLHLYTLRHNFASHLIMNGANLLSVSKLMGHTDIETTISHYAHLLPNQDKILVDNFASMNLDEQEK